MKKYIFVCGILVLASTVFLGAGLSQTHRPDRPSRPERVERHNPPRQSARPKHSKIHQGRRITNADTLRDIERGKRVKPTKENR